MIPEVLPYNNYIGDGATTQFDFDFLIEDGSQLIVEKINADGTAVTLTQDTDYSIHQIGNPNGSYITFPISGSSYSKLTPDEVISLQLTLPISQESEYGTSSELDQENLEYSLDYLTRIAQILARQIERAIKVHEGSNVNTDQLVENINLVSNNIEDLNTVAGDIANVDIVAGDIDNVNDVAGSIGNVNIVAGSIENVDDVATDLDKGADSEIKKVNANKTNIDTVAGGINNINTVATDLDKGNNSAINKVNANKTNIDAVAGGINNVNTVGADLNNGANSAINKVSNNKTNIDLVAGSIGNVNIVAGSIENVDDVATDLDKGADSEIKKVNANKTNIDTVAGSIENVDIVANDINNVNTVATNINAVDDFVAEVDMVNQSKAWETGNVSTDEKGLADVKKYAHSTFDINTITQPSGSNVKIDYNGIASGFTSNYPPDCIELPTIPSGKTFEVDFGAITPTSGAMSSFFSESNGYFGIYTSGTSLYMEYYAGGNHTISTPITINSPIYIKMGFNGTKIYLSTSSDGKTYTTIYSEETFTHTALNPVFGKHWDTHMGSMQFPYDLKQLTMTVDGKIVYRTNKTGVDTIKPVDYTVQGSPTVSADGIVSGFSSTDFLSKSFELANNYNTFEIDFGEITTTISQPYHGQWFFDARETNSSITKGVWFQLSDSLKARIFLGSGESNWDIANSSISTIVYPINKKIRFKLVFTGTQYILYSSIEGAAWQAAITINSTKKVSFDTTLKLGTDGSQLNYLEGSYDINGVKIIKDGEIVWQPCLKIPYTQSKTGSKVVDAVYRDRVEDMYSQFGYAPYYTLSDTDFTLPKGELYGLIRKASNKYSKPNYDTAISVPITAGSVYVPATTEYNVPDDGWMRIRCESFSDGAFVRCFIDQDPSSLDLTVTRAADKYAACYQSMDNSKTCTVLWTSVEKGQKFYLLTNVDVNDATFAALNIEPIIMHFLKNKGV